MNALILLSFLVSVPPGSFGEVRRGRLQPRGRREQAVAIQALWAGGAESLKMTFLGRAALLGQFQHPNILRLEGVVTKSRPVMVLTELMELGPLDSFLRVSSTVVEEEGLVVEESSDLSHFLTEPYGVAPFYTIFHHDLHPSFPDHWDSQICSPNCPLVLMYVLHVCLCLPCW